MLLIYGCKSAEEFSKNLSIIPSGRTSPREIIQNIFSELSRNYLRMGINDRAVLLLSVDRLGSDDKIATGKSINDVAIQPAERHIKVLCKASLDGCIAHSIGAIKQIPLIQIIRPALETYVYHVTSPLFAVT
jgi:hypothetical protein